MRQIAALPEAAAHVVANHLRSLGIETRLAPDRDGWALWVLDEDRVPRAREELDAFSRAPDDPRFTPARKAGKLPLPREEIPREAAAPDRPAAVGGRWGMLLARPATIILILASVGVGVWTSLGKDLVAAEPLLIASFKINVDGINYPDLEQVERGEVWRLVTPIFLHFGPLHLVFNMVWLWQLGGMIEQRRGWWRFLFLVLACAIPSNVAQWFLSEISWNAGHLVIQSNPLFGGMSGVVYGLFGYVWMKGRYEPDLGMQLGSRTVVYMLVWLVLCATGVVGPIANTAHAVGLVVGVVIGILPHWWRLLFSR